MEQEGGDLIICHNRAGLSPGRPEGDYQQAVEIYRRRARSTSSSAAQVLLISKQPHLRNNVFNVPSQAQVREEGYMSSAKETAYRRRSAGPGGSRVSLCKRDTMDDKSKEDRTKLCELGVGEVSAWLTHALERRPDSFARNGGASFSCGLHWGGTKATTQLGDGRCELSLGRMYQ